MSDLLGGSAPGTSVKTQKSSADSSVCVWGESKEQVQRKDVEVIYRILEARSRWSVSPVVSLLYLHATLSCHSAASQCHHMSE